MNLWTWIELIQTPYCERFGSGSFDEPLNAISNLGFAIAALFAMRRIRSYQGISRGARLLPWSLALVAMGSTLYHTYHSPPTYLLDILPLGAFLAGSIYLAMRRLLVSNTKAIMAGAGFLTLQVILLIFVPRNLLNGSTPYLAALLSIPPVIAVTIRQYGSLAWQLMPVAVLFILAFIFRSVDLYLCTWLPIGTHFLWHILGAAAGYFVTHFVFLIESAEQDTCLGRNS